MSENSNIHIDNLIGKYIVGETNPAEQAELRDWCALQPQNQKELDDAVLIYNKAQLAEGKVFDSKAAWKKLQPQLAAKPKGRVFSFPFWKIAASFILIGIASLLIYQQLFSVEKFNLQSQASVQTEILPDQTSLTLNRDSEVAVTYYERKKIGRIQLKGEMLIDIPVSKKVDWIVEVAQLRIADIGTKFNVKSYSDQTKVEVSVLEGEVRMYTDSDSGLSLLAGESGIFDQSTGEFYKTSTSANVTAYSSRNFTFQNQELQKVIAELNTVYQTEIQLSGPVGNCRLTVDFFEEDLDIILAVISETLGLTMSENGNQITMTGTGCN